jgi:hypothetical protein
MRQLTSAQAEAGRAQVRDKRPRVHVDLHLDDRAGYVDRRVADRDRRVSVGRGLDDQARGRAEVVDPVDQDAWWLFCRKSTSCPSGSAHSMS